MAHIAEAMYDDADEAATAIRSTVVSFSLLAPPSRPWRVGSVNLDATALWWAGMSGYSTATGAMKSDSGWLMMTAKPELSWTLNNLPFGDQQIAFVPEGADYAARHSEPRAWISIAFSRDWLARQSGLFAPGALCSAKHLITIDLGTRRAAEARYALRVARDFVRRCPERMLDTATLARLERSVLRCVFRAMDDVDAPDVRHDARTARRLLEYLNQHAEQPVGVSDVCAALGLGDRALRPVFRDVLGTSPADFLRRRRMHLARRAIRSGQVRNVTEAAVRFGFFDMGRFAAGYRRMFGELPSHTLVRSNVM